MRNIYNIEKCHFVHNNLHLSLNENQSRIQIKPVGQILADPDQLAFIYVVEEKIGYSYLKIPQNLWAHLVPLLRTGRNPLLLINDLEIELINFTEELLMLLFNIEGNDNYGTEFVKAVEEVFAEFFANQPDD